MQAGSGGARGSRLEQLRARKQRADEGVEMFRAVNAAWYQGIHMMISRGGTEVLAETPTSEWWGGVAHTAIWELEQAVGMIREGLPYRSTEVRGRPFNRRAD